MDETRGTPVGDALTRFVDATAAVLALVGDVSEAAWRAHPAGEPWSLAETVEHLVLTNQAILARLGAPSGGGEPSVADSAITAAMFDGLPAPPGLAEPTGRWPSRSEGVAELERVRDAIAARVRAGGETLRALRLPHPVFGVFDGIQWVLFGTAHTHNHLPELRQLRHRADSTER